MHREPLRDQNRSNKMVFITASAALIVDNVYNR